MRPSFWLFLISLPVLGFTPVFSAKAASVSDRAVFISVKGKVQVFHDGEKARAAKKDSAASEGDRVVASKDSTATIRLFDGSRVLVSPKTEFRIAKVRGDSKVKKISLKLLLGKLKAEVKKLLSSKSSFEIEAGGVVCGVRGTHFSVEYDPAGKKLHLEVEEGVVVTDSDGVSHSFQGGMGGEFIDGQLTGNPGAEGHSDLEKPQENKAGDVSVNALSDSSFEVLKDLNTQVGTGLTGNADIAFNDTSVGGAAKLNLRIDVNPLGVLP